MSALVKPGWVPGDDDDPWAECEWDDCDTMVHENEDGSPLCWIHHREAIAEDQAENTRKMAKEDETWPEMRQ